MYRLNDSTEELFVGELAESHDDRGTVISAPISGPGKIDRIWFRVSEHIAGVGATPFLPATLFCAMKQGLPLRLSDPVSRQVLENVPLIEAIFNKWYPEFPKVPVCATPAVAPSSGKRVGCFFSGGIDSFYSVLKHQEEIDTLIFVRGFDIWLDDEWLCEKVSGELREIALQLKKPLIEIETNLREFTDQFVDWGLHAFGGALASVAHLLASILRKIYVPSSGTFAHIEPYGSHPLLDPAWGTQSVAVVHDGCEASRIEKAQTISGSDLALKSLRVCYQNLLQKWRYGVGARELNCGRCEKCVRTMLNLYIAGALDRCSTFANPLTPELVRQTDFGFDRAFFLMQDNLRALLEKEGEDSELVRALRYSIESHRHGQIVRHLDANAEGFLRSAAWKGFVERHRNELVKSLWPILKSWLTREFLKEEVKRAIGRRNPNEHSPDLRPDFDFQNSVERYLTGRRQLLGETLKQRVRRAAGLANARAGLRSAVVLPPAGPGSLGDECMLLALDGVLKQRGFERLGFVAYGSDDAQKGNAVLPMESYFARGDRSAIDDFIRAICGYSHFFMIGADILDGYYSTGESLKKLFLTDLAARSGLTTTILGCSFNDSPEPAVIDAMRKLPRSVFLCARDPISQQRLENALRRPVQRTADVGFLLPPDSSRPAVQNFLGEMRKLREEKRVLAGVNLSYLVLGKEPDRPAIGRLVKSYAHMIAQACRQDPNLTFVLLYHDLRGPHNDMALMRRSMAALPAGLCGSRVLGLPEGFNSAEIKAVCGGLDVALTCRMHIAIACLSQGVPVGSLGYQGKFEGLYQQFGLLDCLWPVDQVLENGRLNECLGSLLERRDRLAAQIKNHLTQTQSLAERNFAMV